MAMAKFLKILRLVILGLLLTAFFLPVASVSAHAYLLRSSPAANAHLKTSPLRIDMYFSETVEPSLSDIGVYNAAGLRVDDHATQIDPADFTHLSNTLPPLKDGAYLVTWKVISRSDGHLTGGAFPIYIGAVTSNTASQLRISGSEPDVQPGQVVDKGLLYLAVVILVGGIFFEILAVRPVISEIGLSGDSFVGYTRLFQRFVTVGLTLLGISNVVGIMVQASAFEGQAFVLPWNPVVLVVLSGTQYGVLVLARLAALFGLAGLLLPAINRWRIYAALPLLALIGLTLSLGSHADAQSNFWMVSADLLHLTAASVWVGGLGLFLASQIWAQRRLEPGNRSRLAAGLLVRFSSLAVLSLAILVITGLFESLTDVGSFNGLLHSAYGQVLMGKLGIALAMVCLGGYNHFVVRLKIQQIAPNSPGASGILERFRKLLVIETVLGAVLLVWVGLFTSLPLANPDATIPKIIQTDQVDDVVLKLTVSPGRVGINSYTLQIISNANGRPITQTSEVDLLFYPSNPTIPPSQASLTSLGNGIYTAQGAYLAYEDQWQIRAVLRRPNQFDSYADFWVDTHPQAPWPFNIIAAVLLVCTGIVCAVDVMLLARRKFNALAAVD
ncbi:MAG TPA: CopD family protein [Anaerolineaceae bacterium]|nr:CopD family protein [Anaerolineaceae bacterium]